jgi:hypothetical protein
MGNRAQLMPLLLGHRPAAAIAAAAELGLVDLLGSGPRTAADLAAAAGTDPDATYRLLRALAAFDVLDEGDTRTFALTDLGDLLRSDAPGSLAPQAQLQADPAIWAAWGNLAHSVRTGENAFAAAHGMDVWAHRRLHAERSATFDAMMAANSAAVVGAVTAAYDFAEGAHVVDVGGGRGHLLEAALRRQESLTGTVFDQPHVVPDQAPAGLEGRWSSQGGSFFEDVPPADAYLLKWILHDWPDGECVRILSRCRDSLRPGGVVVVVELLLGRPGYEREAALSDLNMLVAPGGRERSEAEYAALFERAGLRLARVVDTGTLYAILEAVLPPGAIPG